MHKKEYDGSVVVSGCESFKHSEKCEGCDKCTNPDCDFVRPGGLQYFVAKEPPGAFAPLKSDDTPWGSFSGGTKGDTGETLPLDTRELITKECAFVRDVLLQKNKEYGDSALNPLRVFALSDNVELINVRIDDKLSRIANRGEKGIKEDTVLDLIGYLILKRIAEKEVTANE